MTDWTRAYKTEAVVALSVLTPRTPVRTMEHTDDMNDAVLRGMALEDAHAALAKMRAALVDARAQIVYLHEKFQETGSGNAVLAQIDRALAQLY